jgi:hypothetical protein
MNFFQKKNRIEKTSKSEIFHGDSPREGSFISLIEVFIHIKMKSSRYLKIPNYSDKPTKSYLDVAISHLLEIIRLHKVDEQSQSRCTINEISTPQNRFTVVGGDIYHDYSLKL